MFVFAALDKIDLNKHYEVLLVSNTNQGFFLLFHLHNLKELFVCTVPKNTPHFSLREPIV